MIAVLYVYVLPMHSGGTPVLSDAYPGTFSLRGKAYRISTAFDLKGSVDVYLAAIGIGTASEGIGGGETHDGAGADGQVGSVLDLDISDHIDHAVPGWRPTGDGT